MRGEVLSQTEARPPSSSIQPLILGYTHILLPSGNDIRVVIQLHKKGTEETEISIFFIFLGKNVFVLAKNMSIKMYFLQKKKKKSKRAKDKIIVKDISKAINMWHSISENILYNCFRYSKKRLHYSYFITLVLLSTKFNCHIIFIQISICVFSISNLFSDDQWQR